MRYISQHDRARRGPVAALATKTLLLAALAAWSTASCAQEKAAAPSASPPTPATSVHLYGTLQNTLEHAAQNRAAGMRVAVISIGWNTYQPAPDAFNAAYVAATKEKMAAFRKAGFVLQLNFGLQYSPTWIFEGANSHYENQYGDRYAVPDPGSGKQIPNAIFNQAVRARIAAYTERVFRDLGTDWQSVRLGGGWYGELNYPEPKYNGKTNCYWAFDDIAQGRAPGLAAGLQPCPVPGWKPGGASPDHASARHFADWYMNALKNYHDWQIADVRRFYNGNLCMLYPSWGVRPGQIEAAVQTDLSGTTPAEKNGEISRGFDFERYIAGITDPKVIVYGTWLDTNPQWSDESSPDPARWSPAHWLSHLAARHPLKLRLWGENTGRNDVAALDLTFRRIEEYDLMGVMWAFEPDLYAAPAKGYATVQDYAARIKRQS